MSQQGQSLIQIIEGDLAAAGGWIEQEAYNFAVAAWDGIKALFSAMTAEQYTILKGLYQELNYDQGQNMSTESIVADLLTLGTQKEMTWVASIPGQALIAAAALIKQELGL